MEIINWIRDSPESETFFTASYGSYDQDLTVKFYSREVYQKVLSNWSYLIDYWNTGDCLILELTWKPQIDARSPLWAETYQNMHPDEQNYLSTTGDVQTILEKLFQQILLGETEQISFVCSDDQYFAFNTGVVKS